MLLLSHEPLSHDIWTRLVNPFQYSLPCRHLSCWSGLVSHPWCRLKTSWDERTHGWCMMFFTPTRRCAKQCYTVLWNSKCHLKTTWKEPTNSDSKGLIHPVMKRHSHLLCKLVIAAINETFCPEVVQSWDADLRNWWWIKSLCDFRDVRGSIVQWLWSQSSKHCS